MFGTLPNELDEVAMLAADAIIRDEKRTQGRTDTLPPIGKGQSEVYVRRSRQRFKPQKRWERRAAGSGRVGEERER